MTTSDPQHDASKYSYNVIWSEEDQSHVGLCTEFPSLSHLESTPAEALAGITRLIFDTIEDMRRIGETIPEPLRPSLRMSRVAMVVRVSPELHRNLVALATEQQVSFNRLCCDLLALYAKRGA